jgi:hypothetical protein
MIICKICNVVFVDVLSPTHLKKHNISVGEYRNEFGETSTEEYRKRRSVSISQSKKGTTAPNKGSKMSEEQRHLLSALAKQRYKTQPHPSLGRHHSEETKAILSEKSKAVAGTMMAITRSHKAMETKRRQGLFDNWPTKGKKLSEERILKISEGSQQAWKIRKVEIIKILLERIEDAELSLLNDPTDHFLHLQCRKGHEFNRTKQVFIDSKYRKEICPVCYPPIFSRSEGEIEVIDYMRSITSTTVLVGNRSMIYPLELDIYLPDKQLAIEYCGLYYHSELMDKDRLYHINKYKLCAERGIRLITIFEDEWLYRRDLVEARLSNIITPSLNRIYARSCTVSELTPKQSSKFLNRFHLQGNGRSNIRLGLYYKTKLLSVMTFSDNNISRRQYQWEINRYCSFPNTIIVGGASKLFQAFIRQINPEIVISYADLRWSTGAVYEKIGFSQVKQTPPNYWYINGTKRLHRYTLRKQQIDNPNFTEWENRKQSGWNRIWDCGNLKYTWSNQKAKD